MKVDPAAIGTRVVEILPEGSTLTPRAGTIINITTNGIDEPIYWIESYDGVMFTKHPTNIMVDYQFDRFAPSAGYTRIEHGGRHGDKQLSLEQAIDKALAQGNGRSAILTFHGVTITIDGPHDIDNAIARYNAEVGM